MLGKIFNPGKNFIYSLLAIGTILFIACNRDIKSPTEEVTIQTSLQVTTEAAQGMVMLQDTVADYIVLLDDSLDPDTVAAEAGGEVRFIYKSAVRGFAMRMPPEAAFGLSHRPGVKMIVPDGVVSVQDTQSVIGGLWGLDRVDQRAHPLNGLYGYDFTGLGVNVYILDTGIRITHQDFGGRAFGALDAIRDGNGTNDCHGHGTHVAGTVGGSTYGVAKQVRLFAVRVLGCGGSGTWAGVISGIDWVVANGARPAIMSASLGGGINLAVNEAVNTAVLNGVSVVVAAANANQDACQWSPASASRAITVGATSITDARASFSNWGPCLDIFAPGVGTLSAWNTSDIATNTISGTSMATPHVSGVLALFLSAGLTEADMLQRATSGVVIDPNGSVNLLAYSSVSDTVLPPPPPPPDTTPPPPPDTTPPPPPPPPVDQFPVALFNASCPQGNCRFNAQRSYDDSLIVRYDWDFGDGTTFSDTLPMAFHVYTAEKEYWVTLTVVDNHQQSDMISRQIRVNKLKRTPADSAAEIF